MQFYKCCPFLMRMMSPLVVGLIVLRLIVSSTSAFSPPVIYNLPHPGRNHYRNPHIIHQVSINSRTLGNALETNSGTKSNHVTHSEIAKLKRKDLQFKFVGSDMISPISDQKTPSKHIAEDFAIALKSFLKSSILQVDNSTKLAGQNSIATVHSDSMKDSTDYSNSILNHSSSESSNVNNNSSPRKTFILNHWKELVNVVKPLLQGYKDRSGLQLESSSIAYVKEHILDLISLNKANELVELIELVTPAHSLTNNNTSKSSVEKNNTIPIVLLNEAQNIDGKHPNVLQENFIIIGGKNNRNTLGEVSFSNKSLNYSSSSYIPDSSSNKVMQSKPAERLPASTRSLFNESTARQKLRKIKRRGRNYEPSADSASIENAHTVTLGQIDEAIIRNNSKRNSENEFANVNNTVEELSTYNRSSVFPYRALFRSKIYAARRESDSSTIAVDEFTTPTIYELLKPRLRTALPSYENTVTVPPKYFASASDSSEKDYFPDAKESISDHRISDEDIYETQTVVSEKYSSTSEETGENNSNVTAYLTRNQSPEKRVNTSTSEFGSHSNESLSHPLATANNPDYFSNNTMLVDIIHVILTNQSSKSGLETQDHKSGLYDHFSDVQGDLDADGSDIMELEIEDPLRRPKMTDDVNVNNTPLKKPKLNPKVSLDYKDKSSDESSHEYSVPEYRPGSLVHYSDIYKRKPVLELPYSHPAVIAKHTTVDDTEGRLAVSRVTPSSFDLTRTGVRGISSTFYPNRMRDFKLSFGNRYPPTTTPTSPTRVKSSDSKVDSRNDGDPDDEEYRDAIDPGFTMEKLAYLLIGTCCGLSILCLCVVMAAIKCRRVMVEKRLKTRFRKKLYQHDRLKTVTNALPWQQQMFDHFMYLHRHPDSSCSSRESCNCRCVTWSLGPRNLDTRPMMCPTNQNSLYLCGQKKLPFGAASTLRYESMLGRKRPSPTTVPKESPQTPNPDSSHENDSLDQDSDSRESDPQRNQCTCIDFSAWPMAHDGMRRGPVCPVPGLCTVGDCNAGGMDLPPIARDCPPPVTGSNYLDRSEGVVYWSSNDERLI